MRLAVVHNSRFAPLGRFASLLAGIETRHVFPGEGDSLPDPAEVDGLILLGGEMGAYETDRHPHLADECELIRRAVEDAVPLLGICLGSQLIASAFGGAVWREEVPEVGVVPLTLTPAGETHPVVRLAGERVLAAHQDTFELPSGATLLAHSARFPHAFTVGSALGLQFHPEAGAAIVQDWLSHPSFTLPERAGVDRGELLETIALSEEELSASAVRLFRCWLGELSRGSRSSRTAH